MSKYMEMNTFSERKLYRNGLTVTGLFDDEEIENIILIKKVDFLEMWDAAEIHNWKESVIKKMITVQTDSEKSKYQTLLNKIAVLIVDGQRKVCRHHPSSKFCTINFREDIIERYGLKDEIILEGMGNHIRVWNPIKFEAYQKELERQRTREMFLQKIKARKK